ncbi:MAG: hypothetical protein M3Y56_07685 [Armatimonadota bacterium]|nr:hypothetical protein [Armatimonadota bacterium]
MISFKAHFDGQALVPDEPVELPMDCSVEVYVDYVVTDELPKAAALIPEEMPLQRLARALAEQPMNIDRPSDLAVQHDHYLYGAPRRA